MGRLAFVSILLTLNACGTLSGSGVENRKIASRYGEMVCGKVVRIEVNTDSALIVTILTGEGDKVKVRSERGGFFVDHVNQLAYIANIRSVANTSYLGGGDYCSDGKKATLEK